MRNAPHALVVLHLLLAAAPVAAQTTTGAAAPEAPPTVLGAARAPRGLRLRFGVSGSIGAGQADPTADDSAAIANAGLAVRLGAQLDDSWALYYEGAAHVGGSLRVCVLSCDNFEAVLHTSSVVGELTLGDFFHVGIGPHFAVSSLNGNLEAGGGGRLRIAFSTGGRGAGARQGFSIGHDVVAAFFPDGSYQVFATLSVGWESF